MSESPTVSYQRATFVTRLPVEYRYTASHAWLRPSGEGRWRTGFTKFALRMLGEVVDVQIDRAPGAPVQPGDILGSIEGFKALSDLYCVGRGRFTGTNPVFATDLEIIARDPYGAGWFYEFEGEPDPGSLDVHAYQGLLDDTIDRMLARQKAEEIQE